VESLLKAENVSVKLNGREILKKVTCWVERREIMLVLGPNGSGKSTLLKAMMGVVEHEGRVFLDGGDVTALKPSERYRLGLTLAPERLRVAKRLTVEENLAIAGDVERAFELFPELRPLAKKRAGKLSGGERQMVVLARAFISSPKYLLLDEPFQGLFREVRGRVVELIHEASKKSGVVVVTHDEINEVFPLSEKTCVLVGGKAIYFGEGDGAEKLVKEMFM